MSYRKKMIVKLKRGLAGEDLDEEYLPSELREAIEEWLPILNKADATQAEQEEAAQNMCSLLETYLQGNFAADNLPAIRKIANIDDELEPDWIRVTGFHFDDANVPIVNLQAQFSFDFKKDMSREELEVWEQNQDDPLAWCVNFWWSFEDAPDDWEGYLDTNDGVTMVMAE